MSEVQVKTSAIVFNACLVYTNVFIMYKMYVIIFNCIQKSSVKKCEEWMKWKEVQMKCEWSAEMTGRDFKREKFQKILESNRKQWKDEKSNWKQNKWN